MLERFTDRARTALQLANQVVAECNRDHVGSEDILYAILDHRIGGVALQVIKNLGDLPSIVHTLENRLERNDRKEPGPAGKLPMTPAAKSVVVYAPEAAKEFGHAYVGTEHLLMAVVDCNTHLGILLGRFGITAQAVRDEIKRLIQPIDDEVKQMGQPVDADEPITTNTAPAARKLDEPATSSTGCLFGYNQESKELELILPPATYPSLPPATKGYTYIPPLGWTADGLPVHNYTEVPNAEEITRQIVLMRADLSRLVVLGREIIARALHVSECIDALEERAKRKTT